MKTFDKIALFTIVGFVFISGILCLNKILFDHGFNKGYNKAMSEIENVIDYNTMTVESIDSLEAMIKRNQNTNQ